MVRQRATTNCDRLVILNQEFSPRQLAARLWISLAGTLGRDAEGFRVVLETQDPSSRHFYQDCRPSRNVLVARPGKRCKLCAGFY